MSSYLFESTFARIQNSISPLSLPASWSSNRGNLAPDVLISVAFYNELLPDEESGIDPADLKAISDDVVELSALVATSKLPSKLKQLIAHHIKLVEEALAQYQVFGANALREAARTALGEVIESKDAVSSEQQSVEISRLGKLWARVNKVADAALKVEKVAQLGQHAWEAIFRLLPP